MKEGLFIEIDGVEHGPMITSAVIEHVAEVWAMNDQLRSAIDYALSIDDGVSWLHAWQQGDPDAMSELNDWMHSAAF